MLLTILFSMGLSLGHATPNSWDLAGMEIHPIAAPVSAFSAFNNDCTGVPNASTQPFALAVSLGDIVNIGKDIWQIVQAGKPTVTLATSPQAYALPKGLTCWTDLSTWHPPGVQSYEVKYKNLLGMEVVKFTFTLHFNYGGSKDGVGQYLANVKIVPADINVDWLYNLDASVVVDQAINLGTSQNPVAGLGISMNWSVKTPTNIDQKSFQFFVQGDGKVLTPN